MHRVQAFILSRSEHAENGIHAQSGLKAIDSFNSLSPRFATFEEAGRMPPIHS
jgi:hypothetical protein